MDRDERYRQEAHDAVAAAINELGEAQWRLSVTGDYVTKARVEAAIIVAELIKAHIGPTPDAG